MRGITRITLQVLALVTSLGLILVAAQPVHGRWEVPQYVEPVEQVGSIEAADPAPPAPPPDQVEVPILMYHYVSQVPSNADVYRLDLTVKPEDFRAQLQYLADAGYHPITLTDLYLHMTQGYPLPGINRS